MLKNVLSIVFFLNAIIFFFQAVSKNIYPPLLPHFIEHFGIGDARAGTLVTLVFLGYAIARFPSGLLADRWGCTRTILWGSTAMAFAFVFVGIAPGYFSLALLTFILGFASGVYVTAGYTLAVIIGSRKKAATATAFFEIFGMVAAIISPLAVTLFILHMNWRLLFVFVGSGLFFITLLFFFKKKESEGFESPDLNSQNQYHTHDRDTWEKEPPEQTKKDYKGAITTLVQDLISISRPLFIDANIRRFLVWSTLVGGLGALSWTGVNSFLPTLLVSVKGYDIGTANQMFALVAAAGLLTKIGIGWLADKYGASRILLANMACKITIIFAFSFAQTHIWLLALVILWGATSLNSNTLINSHVLRSMPEKYQAAGFGLFSTSYTVIYSCGPYITGSLSELVGLNIAIVLSSFGALLAIILLLIGNRYQLLPENEQEGEHPGSSGAGIVPGSR